MSINTPPASFPAVRVRSPLFRHQGGEALPSLLSLDFQLACGECLCLAGVNGSGKSSLLCLLAGIFTCESGELDVFGQDLVCPPAEQWRTASRRSALLMQDADLQILGATPEEDLVLGLTTEEEKARALRLAHDLALTGQLHEPVHTLSHGQKRKLSLAAALARDPALLLLDEPFSGLDYPAVKELRRILLECKRNGKTLVISTHDLEPVLSFSDHILLLSPDGESIFGSPAAVLPHAGRMGVRAPGSEDFS